LGDNWNEKLVTAADMLRAASRSFSLNVSTVVQSRSVAMVKPKRHEEESGLWSIG
jgi:hypothetical protein